MDIAREAWVQLLYDDRMLQEYREVLCRPRFGFVREHVEALLEFIQAEGESVTAYPLGQGGSDPSDWCFLEVAVSGLANLLVTGNRRHFPRHVPGRLIIATPAESLRWLAGRRKR